MQRPLLASTIYTALTIAGCAQSPGNIDYNLLTADIPGYEYARVVCHGVAMDVSHTCMTQAMQHYRDQIHLKPGPGEATQGPFAMVFAGGDYFSGSYVSDPFSAAFTVRNNQNQQCRGRYSAYAGDKTPVFKVRCDDGGEGTGNIILGLGGRNGLGEFAFTDGRRGRFAFGFAAVDLE